MSRARRIIAFLLAALPVAVALWLAWENRSSEKVVAAVLAPLVLAAGYGISRWLLRGSEKFITAVLAALVALIGVLVFGPEPSIEEVFPASFIYQVDTKMPPSLPWFLESRRFVSALLAPAELFKKRPEFFKDQIDETGDMLYHHLLQKSLIDWMGLIYRGSWQSEIIRFETATVRQMQFGPAQKTDPEVSVILSTQELTKLLEGNKFAGIDTVMPPQIALPPNAKLTIKPPTQIAPTTRATAGEVVIKNRFCTVSVRTETSIGVRSIGSYQLLAGLSEQESTKLWTANYVIRFKAEFSRWLSGNPEMPKYKRWARQLVDGMKLQFDEEIIWRGIRDDHQFLKATGRLSLRLPPSTPASPPSRK